MYALNNSKLTDMVCGAGGLGALGVFHLENRPFEDRQELKTANRSCENWLKLQAGGVARLQ
jgi:hypothetical protein